MVSRTHELLDNLICADTTRHTAESEHIVQLAAVIAYRGHHTQTDYFQLLRRTTLPKKGKKPLDISNIRFGKIQLWTGFYVLQPRRYLS